MQRPDHMKLDHLPLNDISQHTKNKVEFKMSIVGKLPDDEK